MIEGDPRRDRSYRVAMELLHTERTYVGVLHLLDQVNFYFIPINPFPIHPLKIPSNEIPQLISIPINKNFKNLIK